jgi:hypothetical protein
MGKNLNNLIWHEMLTAAYGITGNKDLVMDATFYKHSIRNKFIEVGG